MRLPVLGALGLPSRTDGACLRSRLGRSHHPASTALWLKGLAIQLGNREACCATLRISVLGTFSSIPFENRTDSLRACPRHCADDLSGEFVGEGELP